MNHVQGGYLKIEYIYQFDSMMTMNTMFNVDLKNYRSKKLDPDTLHKDVSMVIRKDLKPIPSTVNAVHKSNKTQSICKQLCVTTKCNGNAQARIRVHVSYSVFSCPPIK